MEIKSLNRDQFIQLTRKTPWFWLKDVLLDWAVIVAATISAIHFNNPISYILAVFIVGNRQHALAILGHDGTHFTLVKSKKINDFITNILSFWPIGLTTSGYRNLHFMHHKHTNTDMDPELAHRSFKKPQWDLPNTPKNILKYAFWDLLGYSLSDYLMIVKFARPDTKFSWITMGVFHVIVAGSLLAFGIWPAIAIWYGALITTFMMQFRLRTWLEHQGSDDTHRLHLNMLERILLSPHNAWYHFEHHQWPSVPYHRLPKLRQMYNQKTIISLKQLIQFYMRSEKIVSGTPLKAAEKKTADSVRSFVLPNDKIAA